jgi:hypothetical protein
VDGQDLDGFRPAEERQGVVHCSSRLFAAVPSDQHSFDLCLALVDVGHNERRSARVEENRLDELALPQSVALWLRYDREVKRSCSGCESVRELGWSASLDHTLMEHSCMRGALLERRDRRLRGRVGLSFGFLDQLGWDFGPQHT